MASEKSIIKSGLPPGKIRFYNNFLPKISAGNYQLTVETKTDIPTNDEGTEVADFSRNQSFIVDGPRFKLGIEDVHTVYPPANAKGEFHKTLPNIVLRKRNLPWERNIFQDKACPWMALLVLEDEEILKDEANEENETSTKAYSRTIKKVKHPKTGFLTPNLPDLLTDEDLDNEKATCFAIDLTWETFKTVVPQKEELPYLTHVREINTGNKELLGMHADGWFSVVVGNRFPAPPTKNEKGESVPSKTIVHLVSLESYVPYLTGKKSANPTDKVRLISLASWQFFSDTPEENFGALINGLEAGGLLKTPLDTNQLENVDAATKKYLTNTIEGGYVPLQYNTRLGEKTMAWYRSPLTPVLTSDLKLKLAFSAESNMIYDKENGLFDLSYAVAWQIGRLMGLSDKYFALNILRWKQEAQRKINDIISRQDLNESLDGFAMPRSLDGMMDSQLPYQVVAEFLREELLPLAEDLAPINEEPKARGIDFDEEKLTLEEKDLAKYIFSQIQDMFK